MKSTPYCQTLTHRKTLTRCKTLTHCGTLASLLVLLGLGSAASFGQDDGVMLNDGQILQIIHSLNDAEIKQAGEALNETENADVRQLAQMIVADHEASNEQVDELLEGELDLDGSPADDTLKEELEDAHESLQDLSGTEYDCAYLRAQITQHEEAIAMSKNQLAVDAKNTGVKQLLTAMGPKLEHHLEMARAVFSKTAACRPPEE